METEAWRQEPLLNTNQVGLLGGVEKPLSVCPPHPRHPAMASHVKPCPSAAERKLPGGNASRRGALAMKRLSPLYRVCAPNPGGQLQPRFVLSSSPQKLN